MKFFAPSHLLQSYSLLAALREIQKLGFPGSEIWFEHLEGEPPSAQQLQALGLEYTFHAPSWDVNPTSRIKAARDFAVKLICGSLDFAADIEAQVVVVHPGQKSNPKNDYQVYESYLLDFLAKLTARAETLGLTIAMEIMDPTPNQLVNTPQVANQWTETFPSLGICFDVAHAGRFQDPLDQLAQLKNVRHIHLSNTTQTIPHTALESGHLDIARILTFIQRHYPQIIVAVEGFDPLDELGLVRHNLAYLKTLGFR